MGGDEYEKPIHHAFGGRGRDGSAYLVVGSCSGPDTRPGEHLLYAAVLVLGESTWAARHTVFLPLSLWMGPGEVRLGIRRCHAAN